MKNFKNDGFGMMELLVVVFIVLAVVATGLFVNQRRSNSNTKTASSVSDTSSDQKIATAQDLTSTKKELDKTDIDSELDTSEIDQALAE